MLTNDAAFAAGANRQALAATAVLPVASALDTNRDGVVSPIDALLIINQLNEAAVGSGLEAGMHFGSTLDASGDGLLSPLDALLVINALSASSTPDHPPAVAMSANEWADVVEQEMGDELLIAIAGDIQSVQRRSRKALSGVAEQRAVDEDQLDRAFGEWA